MSSVEYHVLLLFKLTFDIYPAIWEERDMVFRGLFILINVIKVSIVIVSVIITNKHPNSNPVGGGFNYFYNSLYGLVIGI